MTEEPSTGRLIWIIFQAPCSNERGDPFYAYESEDDANAMVVKLERLYPQYEWDVESLEFMPKR